MYTEVANLVKEAAAKDAANGNDVAARLLPHFDRSLVKQTVMTSVYGVTMIGKYPPPPPFPLFPMEPSTDYSLYLLCSIL